MGGDGGLNRSNRAYMTYGMWWFVLGRGICGGCERRTRSVSSPPYPTGRGGGAGGAQGGRGGFCEGVFLVAV